MARYVATVHTPRSPAETFAYLSDFSSTRHWDPGVAEAQRLDDGPIGVGSRFRVVAVSLGRHTELVYEIVELEPPRRVTLRAETGTLVSLDTMTFAADGDGTAMTYDARLTLKGPLRLADPLMALLLRRIGDRARAGLRRELGAT